MHLTVSNYLSLTHINPSFEKETDSKQDNTLRVPPEGYDSVTGDTGTSIVFMVYDVSYAYPDYLVTYTM